MSSPLVSICIPTRNRASWLRGSLASICGQDYEHLDILVSDNGSDDDTEQVVREAARADARIRYVRHDTNIGLYGNHNFCLDEGRGEFLCLFHDHDERDRSLVSTYVRFMQAHPNVGLVCADWDLIDNEGRFLGTRSYPTAEVTPGLEFIGQTLRSGRSAICLPGAMIRRSALGDIRFDHDAAIGFGDFVIWFRLAERADIGHIHQALWAWRQDQRSESARPIEAVAGDYERNLIRYCDEHLGRWPGHAGLVAEWKRAIHRYLFWALMFEIGLYFRHGRPRSDPHDRTLFEIMDYRLTPEQFRGALDQLAAHQRSPVEWLARVLSTALIRTRLTWPLAWATEHHSSMRALLRLQ